MAKNLEGKNCPKFKADATSDQIVSNETYKSKNVVIYFYRSHWIQFDHWLHQL